ncbi:FAD-dependent oxidoreductase [Rhodococcus koreensis]
MSVVKISEMFDEVRDVVVVGSGAAGLTAALVAAESGADVLLVEKAELLGGTTAFSGGMLWVPNNHLMPGAGIDDTPEDARTYVHTLIQQHGVDDDLVDVYLHTASEMVRYVEEHSRLRFQVTEAFADYYADHPGGKAKGRSIEPEPFEAREVLGSWYAQVRVSPHMPRLTLQEISGSGAAADPKSTNPNASGAAAPAPHLPILARKREDQGVHCLGAALVSGLLDAALRAGVEVRVASPITRLLMKDERVTGVVIDAADGERRVRALSGVVIASGGFEWNPELVRSFLGVPSVHPMTPPTNVGDGLIMGIEAGAALANMTSHWGIPVIADYPLEYEGHRLSIMETPRMEAGVVVVNRSGRRFTNEAVAYHDMAKAFSPYDPITRTWPNDPPVWAVFDQRVRDRIVIRDLEPGAPTPGWVVEAASLGELADAIGIDRAAFLAEIDRFNGHVERGEDTDFKRGTIWFEAYTSGGPSAAKSLARVEEAPFFAVRLYLGSVGTNGGLRTDCDGRVQRLRGGILPGLYAAGNASASACGPAYPAGGITLGEAMTFGYLAGRDLASAPDADRPATIRTDTTAASATKP